MKKALLQPKTYSLGRVDKIKSNEEIFMEKAFRRGFSHGWIFCLDAIKKGQSIKNLESLSENEIHRWRFQSIKI